MTDVPDEAVEALIGSLGWRLVGGLDGAAREALEATAPFIAAQALRDEADRIDAMEKLTAQERVRAHMRSVSLRLRADELEEA